MKKYFPITLFLFVFSLATSLQMINELFTVKESKAHSHNGNTDLRDYKTQLDSQSQFKQSKLLQEIKKTNKKITLINFWASWCGPCMIEMKSLISLKKSNLDNNLEIIGINIDHENQEFKIKEISNRMKIDYRVIPDKNNFFVNLFSVKAVPTTFLFKGDKLVKVIDYMENFNSPYWMDQINKLINNEH
jgi:thiol-disulfide isomerase/thioredoxin